MIIKSTSNIENFLSQKEIKDVLSKIVNIEQQLGQLSSQLNNGTLTVSGLTVTNSVTLPTNSVNGNQIMEGSIPTTKINNTGVLTVNGLNVTSTNVKFLSNSINGDQIINNTISTQKIISNGTLTLSGLSVTTNNVTFQSNSINGNWIIDYTIPTTKINNSGTLTVNGLVVTSQTVTFQNNSIDGNWIKDYTISTTKINNSGTLTVNGLVVTSQTVTFQNNSINGYQIKDSTISTSKLIDGQVTSSKIANNQILTSHINDGQITSSKIANNQITSQHINNNQIQTQHINNNQITSDKILDGQIISSKITNNQITSQHISANQIQTQHINNNQITSDKIADGQIISSKIANNQVTSQHISTNQIQTYHINNNQVTSDKIQQLTNNLVFSNTVSGVGIQWNSKNSTSDYQFIRYYQDASEYLNTYDISSSTNNTNNGTLVIGVEGSIDNTSGEQVVIRTGQRLIIDQNVTGQSQNQSPINIVEFWSLGSQKAKIDPNGILTVNGLNVTTNTVTFTDNSINGTWIKDYTIPTTKINNTGVLTVNGLNVTSTTVTFQNNSINGYQIIDNTIPTSKIINNGTLTLSSLTVTNTVTFTDNSINGTWIKDYTIPTTKINNNGTLTVNGLNVTSTSVTFQSNSINGNQIIDGSIQTSKIANGQITVDKIATGQVTSQKIQQLTNNLVFSNTVSGIGIQWNNGNSTSDYQFIRYYWDATGYSNTYDISTSNNNGTLVIGVESDVSNTSGEQVVIRTGQRLIIDQNASNQSSQTPINIVEFWSKGVQKARIDPDGNIYGNKVYNAVWNDFAELREQETTIEPGYVQFMNEQTGKLTKKYHKYAVGIVSDTYGIILGVDTKSKKIKKGQVPIQVQGRVLQYFSGKLKVGDQVCQQKDGTVRKMKWWEKIFFPEKMLGVVDEIPTYETWGEDNIKVNGRIWVRVK